MPNRPQLKLRARGVEITFPRRPLIMGIVNLSVDSFSGDGVADVDAAIEKARGLLADGADIIDVGAESARTNRAPISEAEEAAQLVRFIERWEGGEGSRECFSCAAFPEHLAPGRRSCGACRGWTYPQRHRRPAHG